MAYDYDVDIFAALWVGGEENEEPYDSFITANGALTNEVSERRILSSIELLRSHMELIQTRSEANLLLYALARMLPHTAGGSNPFSPGAAKTEAIGNVTNPQFLAGANVSISFDGITIPATSASGGDCATVAAELNVSLDVPGTPVPEKSNVFVNAGDAEGSLGSKYFTLNSANDATNYYVWMNHFTRAETTEITVSGDTNGDLAGTRFTINGSGGEEYYVWYSHDGVGEETEITVIGDTGGNRAENYFTINSAGDATNYYVWYSHNGLAEKFTVTANAADVDGSLGGAYFFLKSATDVTAYYAWLKHLGIGETFTIDFTAAPASGYPFAAVTGAWFDATSSTTTYRFWFSGGGTTAPAVTTETLVPITFTGAEAAIATAGLVVTELIGADPDFASAADGGTAIVTTTVGTVGPVTDAVDGTTSAAFLVTQEGVAAAVDPAQAGTAIEIDYSVNDAASTIGVAMRFDIGALGDFNTTGEGADAIVTTAAAGVTTDAVDGTTGFGFLTNTQGLGVAETDPAPFAGTGIEIMYAVDDSQLVLRGLTAGGIGALGDFGAVAGAEGLVTVTNAAVGPTTDATGGTSGFAVSITQQGLDAAETDPAPAEGIGLQVMYSVNATAGNLAEGTSSVIAAAEGIGASDVGALVTATTAEGGSVVDAADVDTGFVIDVVTQGLDRPTDPAPFGLTGIPVSYTVGGDVTQGAGPAVIATDIKDAILGNADFGATVEGQTVFVTNAADGPTTDLTDGDTGFIFTVTQQGADTSDSIPVQAFCTIDNRLGFRSQEDFLTFTVNNGTGGIIGPAGIIPGPRLSSPKKVANSGRDSATSYVSKKKRNNPLTP